MQAVDRWPVACVNGHPLRANSFGGWTPCKCACVPRTGARAPLGHNTIECESCGYQWREYGCDEVGEWHPLREPWPEGKQPEWCDVTFGGHRCRRPRGHREEAQVRSHVCGCCDPPRSAVDFPRLSGVDATRLRLKGWNQD